jgi:acetyl-CoA carboxylase biotin carboxyl carrier protein
LLKNALRQACTEYGHTASIVPEVTEEPELSEQKIAYYLSFSDVIQVLRLVDETPFQELELELEDLKVRIVQDKETPARHAAASVSEPVPAAPAEPVREQAVAAAIAVTGAVAGAAPSAEGRPVLAPLAGIFYRAPSPGEPPFVEVGAAVKEGDVVGILEIMKLMNHVTAPCSGVIGKICARNEEFVEFGQVLAFINPARVE